MVSRTALYPTRHGIPHGAVFHTAWYAARRGVAACNTPALPTLGGPRLRSGASCHATTRPCAMADTVSTPSLGNGLTPTTSAPRLDPPSPCLHRDWAHPYPHLHRSGLGSPPPHLHRTEPAPAHICTGTGLAPATSAPRLSPPLPHRRHRDWRRVPRVERPGGLNRESRSCAAIRHSFYEAVRTGWDEYNRARPVRGMVSRARRYLRA